MLVRLKENRRTVGALLSDPRTGKVINYPMYKMPHNQLYHTCTRTNASHGMLTAEENIMVSVILPITACLLAGINVNKEPDDQTVIDFQTELVKQLNGRFSENGCATTWQLFSIIGSATRAF